MKFLDRPRRRRPGVRPGEAGRGEAPAPALPGGRQAGAAALGEGLLAGLEGFKPSKVESGVEGVEGAGEVRRGLGAGEVGRDVGASEVGEVRRRRDFGAGGVKVLEQACCNFRRLEGEGEAKQGAGAEGAGGASWRGLGALLRAGEGGL